ncbi:hypothetical protein [Mesorhizobium sp. M7A.F.Ca.MR.362.00.0.0]|uniref:hypothetical protein n=1 Tax=Mesorhizobium sp. M7A.F.Ca.MR.362.00.0.0 TaxID=2496779 RepID=UPI000FD53C27|nr:hypothetical protein [Mesorhizobium sp. M7A.F.Ca.MR.362.00.0.0]RUU79997.1 hypothetical protein EOC06_13880 [Mesorhizobium sp. M7A.F.Ca.MR.362.00.0.0]
MSLETRHAILDALLTVLDADHAEAVLDHRKTKKCALTVFAAKLLAKQFALCPDPNAAAEEMIIRGWTGFKADWMRKAAKTTGKRNFADVAMEKFNGPESVFGSRRDVELVSTGHGQSGSDDGNLRGGFAGPFAASRH